METEQGQGQDWDRSRDRAGRAACGLGAGALADCHDVPIPTDPPYRALTTVNGRFPLRGQSRSPPLGNRQLCHPPRGPGLCWGFVPHLPRPPLTHRPLRSLLALPAGPAGTPAPPHGTAVPGCPSPGGPGCTPHCDPPPPLAGGCLGSQGAAPSPRTPLGRVGVTGQVGSAATPPALPPPTPGGDTICPFVPPLCNTKGSWCHRSAGQRLPGVPGTPGPGAGRSVLGCQAPHVSPHRCGSCVGPSLCWVSLTDLLPTTPAMS